SEPGTWNWYSTDLLYPEIRQKELASLDSEQLTQIEEEIQNGDWLVLQGKVGDLFLNTVNIQISDPRSLFEPNIVFGPFAEEMPLYSFQVINGLTSKSIVRMDTTLEVNAKVFDLYRDSERYELIHIPDFQTYFRLLSYDSEGFYVQAAKKYPEQEWFYGLEYPSLHTGKDHLLKLTWGNMIAAPSSDIYSLEEFAEASSAPLEIWVEDEKLPIKKCVVVNSPKSGDADFALLEGDIQGQLQTLLQKQNVLPETSILIIGIQTEKDGQTLQLPTGFVIQVGQEKTAFAHELSIEEVAGMESLLKEEDPDLGIYRYEQIPLIELIAILTEHRTNRMELINVPKDIFLNVSFVGEGYSRVRAHEHLLNALKKKYRFRLEHQRLTKLHWKLQVVNPDRLEPNQMDPDAEAEKEARVFDPRGYHLLTGYSLKELALYIEDQYGELIETWPHSYGKQSFVFGLDFGDFSELQRQLENEFGLRLFESDRLFNGMRVRFMHDPS
ncbi:MAG: hypothetical protein AAGH79_12175, partial [Bacteroidota bacterium]